jgi:hypothetical protein
MGTAHAARPCGRSVFIARGFERLPRGFIPWRSRGSCRRLIPVDSRAVKARCCARTPTRPRRSTAFDEPPRLHVRRRIRKPRAIGMGACSGRGIRSGAATRPPHLCESETCPGAQHHDRVSNRRQRHRCQMLLGGRSSAGGARASSNAAQGRLTVRFSRVRATTPR